MKKQYYILILVSLLLFSCGKDNQLSVGETITKKITIDFDSISLENNDWHIFNFDKDKGLEVSFSKGKVNGNEYIITAKEYYKDSKPIIVTLSSDIIGTYSFKLIYSKSSEDLEVDFKSDDSIEFPELVVRAKWKKFIPYIVIVLVALLILLFLYKRSITFSRGTILITEPKSQNFKLKGLTKFDSEKEGCFLETGISFILKKGRNGHPKIISKSKDTVLYINNKIEPTGKIINKNYTVKLVKEEKQLIFKYI